MKGMFAYLGMIDKHHDSHSGIMTVKKLIEELGKYGQDLEVLCYTEDNEIVPPQHIFRLLSIESVGIAEGEKRRGDDDIPSLKLGASEHSQKHVILHVTGGF